MTDLTKPEGQTTSDNFLTSEIKKDFLYSQSQWGELSSDEKSYLEKKGMTDPQQLLKSYRELEKSYSSKIALPKDGDKKALDKLYSHLGMPKDTNGFDIEFAEEDQHIGEAYKQFCLDNHILPQTAQAMYQWFTENRAEAIEQENKSWKENSYKELEEVKQDWGDKASRNWELMKRGMRLVTEEDSSLAEDLERALGTKRMMNAFCKLGEAVAEDNPVSFGPQSHAENKEWNAVEYFRDMFNDY